MEIQLSRLDPINMFNPVTFVCLFQDETGCDPINMFNPVIFVCLFQEEKGCDHINRANPDQFNFKQSLKHRIRKAKIG